MLWPVRTVRHGSLAPNRRERRARTYLESFFDRPQADRAPWKAHRT